MLGKKIQNTRCVRSAAAMLGVAIAAGFIFMVLFGFKELAYGQDAEPIVEVQPTAEAEPGVPGNFGLVIDIDEEDVLIDGARGRYLILVDQDLHIKIDALIERVASLEATLLSQADAPTPAPPSSPAININTATYDQLLTVPGIGPVKAGSIVAERGQSGAFASWADLMRRVAGVGPATVADMQTGGAVIGE